MKYRGTGERLVRDRRLVQAYSSPMPGERSFVVLRYVNKVPTIGGCTKCPCKFFAPAIYKRDAPGAEHYLQNKFNEHRCAEEVKVQVVRRW